MKEHGFLKGVLTAMIVSGLAHSGGAQQVTMTVDRGGRSIPDTCLDFSPNS